MGSTLCRPVRKLQRALKVKCAGQAPYRVDRDTASFSAVGGGETWRSAWLRAVASTNLFGSLERSRARSPPVLPPLSQPSGAADRTAGCNAAPPDPPPFARRRRFPTPAAQPCLRACQAAPRFASAAA